jgi:uncharacterized membrane protein YedE/YeeE
MGEIPAETMALLIGASGGLILGLAARLGGFCTLGALESAAYGGDQRQMRMWGLALATAVLGCFALSSAGLIDFTQMTYHRIAWNPLASVFGGLAFGYGMALAGNCGYGALSRVAGGDLRALAVVVAMAITAYMTLHGPLAPLRALAFPVAASSDPQSIALDAGTAFGVSPALIAAAIAVALAGWAMSHPRLRGSPFHVGWSVAVGGSVVWALAGTTWLRDASLDAVPVEGHSFVAPAGETLLWLMTAPPAGPGFAVGSVLGVVMGAGIGSLWRRQFRWEACDDPRELGRQVAGGALMGIGGVVAMGCSVGQGLTAFATLAYSAPVTLAAICAGGLLGLRHLISGFQPE